MIESVARGELCLICSVCVRCSAFCPLPSPQYDYFAQLLKAPMNDAQLLMDARFPYPRFIECVEKGSQSRFLMAKLNPSITQSTMEYNQGSEPPGHHRQWPSVCRVCVCLPPCADVVSLCACFAVLPVVFTEDVSMKVFMQHLRRLAVQD